MINKLKGYALSIVALLTLLAPTLVPAVASASGCTPTASNVEQGANLGSGTAAGSDCNNASVSNSSISHDARTIVDLFSVIVGAVSVVMIIYGGFRYITSGGDSGRVGNAKNTLIYAIVGLVIVALAQLIVHFVLSQASNVSSQA